MSYIGTPPSNAFTSLLKQDFSTSATTGYTLDHAVNNANDIALFINFVRQEPTAGYAASGTTLTLTSATASSDDMYCVYLGQALQTVNPPNASVGLSQLTATGTKDATTFLRGDNTFASAGGANTPAFHVNLSSSQSVSDNTTTKVQFNSETFDTNNAFDNSSNYRFTPQTSGKYFVYFSCIGNSVSVAQLTNLRAYIYKNGSQVAESRNDVRNEKIYEFTNYTAEVVTLNGSDDYIEFFGRLDHDGNGVIRANSYAGAYKIIE